LTIPRVKLWPINDGIKIATEMTQTVLREGLVFIKGLMNFASG